MRYFKYRIRINSYNSSVSIYVTKTIVYIIIRQRSLYPTCCYCKIRIKFQLYLTSFWYWVVWNELQCISHLFTLSLDGLVVYWKEFYTSDFTVRYLKLLYCVIYILYSIHPFFHSFYSKPSTGPTILRIDSWLILLGLVWLLYESMIECEGPLVWVTIKIVTIGLYGFLCMLVLGLIVGVYSLIFG